MWMKRRITLHSSRAKSRSSQKAVEGEKLRRGIAWMQLVMEAFRIMGSNIKEEEMIRLQQVLLLLQIFFVWTKESKMFCLNDLKRNA
jgi:hypothetical protein